MSLATDAPALSRTKRFLQFPLTRIVVAVFFSALAGGLTMAFASEIAGKDAQAMWPELLAAAAVLIAYWIYVRWFEKRPVSELSRVKALRELGAGLGMGAALVTGVIGLLYILGVYAPTGTNGWSMEVAAPFASMVFVGAFEEVLCRGIVFRITEKSLGSWAALVISSLLFGLAHVPGNGAGVLAILITIVAGAFFAAAYMLTRRLWLCIGIHVAWNYTLGSIFSITVSGRESKGLLLGTLSGPEWLTGGAYGLEASVLTLFALAALGACFLWRAVRKGHVIAPFWRTGKSNPPKVA
jgi:membrane protease YdiL (CAAX protease family)